jgi:hypothetical protein
MLKPKKQQDQQDQQSQPSQKQDEQQQHQHQQQESKPDVPPKLPPTHPLATGQHSDKQAAVPLAGAGAGAAAPDAGSSSIANAVNEQYHKSADDNTNKPPVSPVGPTPISKDDRTVSYPVSAMSADEDKPLPVPKTETAPVTADKVETTGMQLLSADLRTPEQANSIPNPAPLPSQTAPQASQPATSENSKPNGTAPFTTTTTAAAASSKTTEVQPPAKVSSESSRVVVDEKMPVMAEEPPEIKAKAAAPGMSATSGPLDDFPLEGDKP